MAWILADFLSVLPFLFLLPTFSSPLLVPLLPSLLLPLCSIRMHLWLFPHVWAYRHQRSILLSQWTEVQWFSWASCQQVSEILLSSAPLNSECAPTCQVLRVLGFKLGSLCLHGNQFTNGVITQPSPAFLKSETVQGENRASWGSLEVTYLLTWLWYHIASQIQSTVFCPRMKSQLIIYLVKMWLESYK